MKPSIATLQEAMADWERLAILLSCGRAGRARVEDDCTIIEYHPDFAPLAADYLRPRKSAEINP